MTGNYGTRPELWTKEHEDRMRDLFAKGLSSSLIARALNREFNTNRSRNSVIGRIYRLGLKRVEPSKPTVSLAYPKGRKMPPSKSAKASKPPPAPKPIAKPVLVPMATRPFWERRQGECWWPFGEGAEMHCCCRPIERGNLCWQHSLIGYMPQKTSEKELARSLRRHL